ncbi:MAG: hypothetical protein M3361_19750, partial [Candidatus Tectomicrobia bacterium]|nr:hypothetical protein [Candidatus Tectomicrobia bacterium]
NVPIHEAFTIVDFAGTLGQLPPVGGVHKFVTGRNREEPVTLAEWNSATGTVELQCRADGTGRVRIEARDLLPHYAYTAWQVFAVTDNPLPFPFPTPIAPAPLSGVPAIIVADAQGNAIYERNLSYCPLDRENPLMYIALYVHWDHRLYGAVPEQSFLGLPTGLVGADHLCFPTGNHLLEAQP